MTGVDQFELILGLLAVVVALSSLATWARFPAAAAFTLGGMLIALVPGTPSIEINPDLVLVLFLPPLLQASAIQTVWRDFVAELGPILVLALGAVLFTTAAVGLAAKAMMPALPWAACFALGAIVSPPDAVAAKAVLHTLRLPRVLVTILEGESLVNDATGLVLYRFAVAAALSGTFSAGHAVASFALVSAGGIGIGVAWGILLDLALRMLRDRHHAVMISFLAGWASYILAERLHVSGVLAVVSCGLLMGWRQHETVMASVRIRARSVWELVTFTLEALVFVLIGLSLRGIVERMGADHQILRVGLPLTLVVTAVVIASRFAVIYPSFYLHRVLTRHGRAEQPAAMPLALSWAGMRGVVSLAAALALPETFPGRDVILLTTFGVILVTVLGQGMTIGRLAAWLDLTSLPESGETLSLDAARARVLEHLAQALEAQLTPRPDRHGFTGVLDTFRARAAAAAMLAEAAESFRPELHVQILAALGAIAHGRRELLNLHRNARIHDAVLQVIETELDWEETQFQAMLEAT